MSNLDLALLSDEIKDWFDISRKVQLNTILVKHNSCVQLKSTDLFNVYRLGRE